MLGDALSWYMTSLAEFWGSAFRIGLPQILIIILLICWLRKKGGSKSWGKRCGWMWCCKWCGEDEEGACSDRDGGGGHTGGNRCRQGGETEVEAEADDEGDGDE
ncbi:MAG: hypothetical protein F4139_07245 [Gemmatimonadetes bacterium]|nr:hypothetical protein [Gemmatimonadota bacterium]MYH52733.1 hypothetical protein [Gemmatimonadota bacterium]MYK67090.1 hypothetical protein [Gemmatimonadota bacterium]